jgi:hypothetical protein
MSNRPELISIAAAALAALAAIGCTIDPADPADSGDPAPVEDAPDDVAEAAMCPAPPPIDIDRSLFVSPTNPLDQAQLRARFSASRIMAHLLASSGAARPASGTELFRRWWDTQNSGANARFVDNPHCDDAGGTINGFPVACQRNEGVLASGTPDGHFPVALIYRPDLAAADGSSCGEARVVIAKPNDPTGRNLAIFEASIPNPDPGCGVVGCRKIAQFWAGLSAVPSFAQRLDALERFYFTGLTVAQDGVATPPALDAANLGLPGPGDARKGQIRTNQFMAGPSPQIWQLRELKLARACAAPGDCKLFFEPASVKTNPHGVLFDDRNPHPLGPAFRDDFLDQIPALAATDINAISMSVFEDFDAGQSNAQGPENQYVLRLGQGDPAGFRKAIADQLAVLGIPLTPEQIAARATTQSCGGCHQLSNGAPLGGVDPLGNPARWPPSAGFVHVLENGGRSPALNTVFLPQRRRILERFLRDTCSGACPAPIVDPTPIAGRAMVH